MTRLEHIQLGAAECCADLLPSSLLSVRQLSALCFNKAKVQTTTRHCKFCELFALVSLQAMGQQFAYALNKKAKAQTTAMHCKFGGRLPSFPCRL
jgi:hypothetical protein